MTCKERGRVAKLTRAMQYLSNIELSSHEGTRSEFNPGKRLIKLGIDVHQEFYVVVLQEATGGEVEKSLSQGRSGHRGRAQESHRGRGPPTRCRPVADQDRSA